MFCIWRHSDQQWHVADTKTFWSAVQLRKSDTGDMAWKVAAHSKNPKVWMMLQRQWFAFDGLMRHLMACLLALTCSWHKYLSIGRSTLKIGRRTPEIWLESWPLVVRPDLVFVLSHEVAHFTTTGVRLALLKGLVCDTATFRITAGENLLFEIELAKIGTFINHLLPKRLCVLQSSRLGTAKHRPRLDWLSSVAGFAKS